MIKYVIFCIIGVFAMIAQWLCMTEVNGIRAIYQWPSVTAFLAFLNPLSSLMSQDDTAQLVIAVVSRLEHFERRMAIRSTWRRLKRPETAFYFVMPEHPCPIDPQWRIKDSECLPWHAQVLPNMVKEQVSIKPYRTVPTGKKVGSTRPGLPRDGLGFHIKFPVAVEQVGLSKLALKSFLRQESKANVTVELLDAVSGEIILHSNYGLHELSHIPSDDGFIYKKVDEENLYKGFEGLLRIRPSGNWSSVNLSHLTCNIDWNKVFGDDGPIVWSNSYLGSTVKPSLQNFCPLITLIYNIPDLQELKQICVASETQNKCQENKNRNLMTKLVEEMEDNEDDIYLAPELVDSESGSAKSVISFINWLVSSQSPMPGFDHILITEDTSYIALDKIQSRLLKSSSSDMATGVPSRLWRSFFNYNKPVKHHGAEAVNNYFSPFYPPTPSPAGSVLSRELALVLTNDMNYLMHGFANIANSLAIWLAPIVPTYYDEPDWFHDLQEAKSATLGEAIGIGNVRDKRIMTSLHHNYTKCGKIDCY